MENQNVKDKIIKTATICKITTKVLYIISILAFITFLTIAIVYGTTGAIKTITKVEAGIVFGVLSIYSFVLIGFLWNVERLFISIEKHKTPFNNEINKYIKIIAIYIIVVSCIPALIGSILINELAPNSEFVFRIEVIGIISGIVLLLIGFIFKYGNQLQIREDETL